jgi:CRP-like cAMP-binding protein
MNVAEQLQQIDLFREVALDDLYALTERLKREFFPKGTVLFHANDIGDTMYIIEKGRIRIFMHDEQGEELTLTHYGVNEIFGELSPIDGLARSASAAAVEDLEVLALHQEDFLAFLDERPQIGLAMMRSLSERLRNTTTYLEEYRPARFEVPEPASGEMMRRGAQGMVADILDEVDNTKTRDKIVVPRDFQPEKRAPQPEKRDIPLHEIPLHDDIPLHEQETRPMQSTPPGALYANLDQRTTEEPPQKSGGGIFDMVAKATQEKDDEDDDTKG